MQHLTIALRMLAKRPGLAAGRLFTVTIVVTAVSAVFTVANVTFLRPLPFPHADRLLRLYLQSPGRPEFKDANPLTPLQLERYRERVRSLERIEGIWSGERALTGEGEGEAEAVPAGRVTAGFFTLFGGEIEAGRVFTEQEAAADDKLAVLSHALWTRRYGADRRVIGRSVIIDGDAHVIVGVMRRGFEPAFVPSQLWTPLSTRNPMARTALTSVVTYGLLPAGGTAARARAEIDRVFADLVAENPALLKGWSAGARDMREAQFGAQGPAVVMLLVAVAALGLIAVANLANLTLADVLYRRADFAVKAALGASRLDLAAGEIAEALILAGAGGLGGLIAASWLVPAMLALDRANRVAAAQATIDWRVALCGFAVAAIVMLAAIAAPVLRIAGPGIAAAVAAGSRRASGGPGARRIRAILVTAQTALALVLLSSGAQVVAALHRASRLDPGFDPSHVIAGQLRLSANLFPEERDRTRFVERVLERLRAAPGVVEAGTTLNTFTVNFFFTTLIRIEDRPSPDGQPYTVQYRRISPGYLEAMRIPIVRGRAFDARDRIDAPLVAIVSRGFARRFWGDEDPLGKRIQRGNNSKVSVTVVGVAGDVRDVGLNLDAADILYTPYFQGSNAAAPVGLVVRTAGDPRGAVADIKRAIWQVDPNQPLAGVVTLNEFLADSLGAHRFRAMVIAACGAVGLLLATIGTYGVTARSVVERTREVGIRLALGGSSGNVWWTMAWAGARAVAAGAIAGIVTSIAAGAGLAALLPDVGGGIWKPAAACAAALLVVGGLAAAIAARAAVGVDPLVALRER
ncbi:MAG TPA: ABC transporter permease [Vicinamibacterales bacterium]|nr:ABC transporter permease [Vicinamibacterales bacterium]